MTEKLVLMGAGGKVGVRSAANLAGTDFEVAHVEIFGSGTHPIVRHRWR